MKRYAEYARVHLIEHHVGTLPDGDGWVIYSNQGKSAKVERFLELVKETYGTSDPVWDDDGVTAVVAMEGIGEEEPDFADLAELLCESFDAGDAVDDTQRQASPPLKTMDYQGLTIVAEGTKPWDRYIYCGCGGRQQYWGAECYDEEAFADCPQETMDAIEQAEHNDNDDLAARLCYWWFGWRVGRDGKTYCPSCAERVAVCQLAEPPPLSE